MSTEADAAVRLLDATYKALERCAGTADGCRECRDLHVAMKERAVPEHIREGLARHVVHHAPTGSFLTAVLENDLVGALLRADAVNRWAIHDIVAFIYNDCPSPCWGSPAKVKAWLAARPS